MILAEYHARRETAPPPNLAASRGVGLTGVGDMLVEELLTLPKGGVDPAVEAAIEAFAEAQRAKAARVAALAVRAAAGGVRGMAAAAELRALEAADTTETNRVELTLDAAKRRAEKRRGSVVVRNQKAAAEEEVRKAHEAQRSRMAARRAMFEKK